MIVRRRGERSKLRLLKTLTHSAHACDGLANAMLIERRKEDVRFLSPFNADCFLTNFNEI